MFCFFCIEISVSVSGLSMPTKMRKKFASPQHPQQFRIVGEIHRRFGGKPERVAALLLPRAQRRQEALERLLVADEVVVDEIHMAAMPEPVERVELGEHLLVGLGARHPAVQLDDVAEFAVERTAPGKLHADIQVVLEIEQVEPRRRALGDVGLELHAFEHAALGAGRPRIDELIDEALGLAQHEKVRVTVDVRARHGVGAADRHRLAAPATHLDDLERIVFLRQHPAGHDEIGPGEVGVGQLFRVAVDEAQIPRRRQQRGERDQAERRRRAARPPNIADRLQVPERIRIELRKHQERVRARSRHRLFLAVRLCQGRPQRPLRYAARLAYSIRFCFRAAPACC